MDLVPSEVTERRNPGFGILNAFQGFFDTDALLLVNVQPLIARSHVQSNLFLPGAEELRFGDAVRDEEPARNRKQARWRAFDDKQNLPWRHAAADLRDAVRECSSIGICHCCSTQEDSVAEANFLTRIEEAQVERDARAEHGFCYAEEETACH